MSGSLTRPNWAAALADLQRRIGMLERRTSPGRAAGTPTNDDIIFSYAGTLTETESPPAKLRYGGFLAVLAVALGTAGSSDTDLDVKRNGTTVATVTVPSSSADYSTDIGVRVAAEDRITIEIVTAGTGAANMTAAARFT